MSSLAYSRSSIVSLLIHDTRHKIDNSLIEINIVINAVNLDYPNSLGPIKQFPKITVYVI